MQSTYYISFENYAKKPSIFQFLDTIFVKKCGLATTGAKQKKKKLFNAEHLLYKKPSIFLFLDIAFIKKCCLATRGCPLGSGRLTTVLRKITKKEKYAITLAYKPFLTASTAVICKPSNWPIRH
jgi:hypothetical protein